MIAFRITLTCILLCICTVPFNLINLSLKQPTVFFLFLTQNISFPCSNGPTLSVHGLMTTAHAPGETLITGCKWYGEGKVHHVQDNDPSTYYTPPEAVTPHFFGICPGLYNLTKIQLTAQNHWSLHNQGINWRFKIRTNNEFFHPTKFNISKGWNLCEGDAKFRAKGEVRNFTCAPDASIAQSVMLLCEYPFTTHKSIGPYIAEIRLFGTRIGDGTIAPEPKDEKPVEAFYQAKRRAVFENVTEFWYEPSYAYFNINQTLEDVALAWGHDKIMSMACDRGKGRIVAILGQRWLDEIDTASYLAQFKRNILNYLGKGEHPKLVNADSNYGPGDVIVLKRHMQFDMEKLKNDVLQGKNGLLVSYLGSSLFPKDKTTQVLGELGLTVTYTYQTFGVTRLNPASVIESLAWVPVIYTLKYVTESWDGLRISPIPRDFMAITGSFLGDLTPEKYQTLLNKMLLKYRPYFEDRFPCNMEPYQWENKTRQNWINYNVWAMSQYTDNGVSLPGTHIFPGRVGPDEKPITHRVSMQIRRAGIFNPTGVYVNPGSTIKWKVINYTQPSHNFFFVFGCHTDHIENKRPWLRWPRQMHSIEIAPLEGKYFTPIGGPLFIRSWRNEMNITVELENVYRHPWFDLSNKSSVNDWENERKRYKSVPWSAFIGDAMHTCLRTQDIVKLNREDMTYVTNYLDNVVKLIHNFRGSNWKDDGVQVFATDIQIAAGWGHSGMPIVGYLPWGDELTNVPAVKAESAIGLTHEIGHNLQNWPITLQGGVEVTNNVYHFPVYTHLIKVNPYGADKSWALNKGQVDGIINTWNGTKYVGVNDGYYNWLGKIFGEGILVNMWHLGFSNGNKLKAEEQKTNFWVSELCKMTEYNMIPWHELWKFPLNNETQAVCGQYRCFFPDDFITQKVPDIVNRQLAKCNGTVDRQPKKQIASQWDILKDLNTQREPWISFL